MIVFCCCDCCCCLQELLLRWCLRLLLRFIDNIPISDQGILRHRFFLSPSVLAYVRAHVCYINFSSQFSIITTQFAGFRQSITSNEKIETFWFHLVEECFYMERRRMGYSQFSGMNTCSNWDGRGVNVSIIVSS